MLVFLTESQISALAHLGHVYSLFWVAQSLIKGCLYQALSKRCSTEQKGTEECLDAGEEKSERERLSR